MSVKTPDQFFELLTKSNILEPHRLEKAKELTDGTSNVKDVARQLIKANLITKWQAAKLLSGKTNLMIGKYRLLGQIGGTSTGTVFLAEHAQMNRRVALKALLHRDHSPESTQKFLEQARAVSSLEHVNLTRAYDIDIQDQYYYLVLEHVQGRSVEQVLEQEGKFDPHAAASYIRQAADALNYAHGKGLQHRDIRPTNLMISDDGDLKLLNLGVVKLSDPADPPADDSTKNDDIEHATYLSPEQARGSENIDARSDIYSLGCVMFAMLTGEPPLTGKTYGEIVKKHQTSAPKKILDLNPGLSRDLAKICLKMLGKKREDRFQSAAQIVKFLDKWLEANPATAPEPAATPVEPLEPVTSSKPPAADEATGEQADAEPDLDSIGIAVADAPAPVAGGFSINTESNRRRKSKPAKKAPAAKASKPAADADPEASGGSHKKMLLIGGAAGGGVLALAAVILVVVFAFSGDDEEQVAQVTPDEQSATQADADDPQDSDTENSDPENSNPESDTTEPDTTAADAADPADADAEVDPEAEQVPAEEAPAEEPEEEAEPDLQALLAKSSAPEEPAEEPEQPAEESETPAEKPEEKPPADQPEEEPAETEAEAGEEKPADPPAENKKPRRTPEQVKEPLKQLAQRVALPPLEAARSEEPAVGVGATVAMGKVFDALDEGVFAELLGGDQIKHGALQFELERDVASAVDNRKWYVAVSNERSDEPKRRIAEFAIEDFNLTFRWLEPAAEIVKDANEIRNCMFLMIVGKQEKAVALRTPQLLEPISVNLSGRASRTQVDVDSMPDQKAIQIKVTKVEGFPEKVSLPPTPFPAEGGAGVIGIGEPGQETVQFQVVVNGSGRRTALSVSPFFKITGMTSMEPFLPAKLGNVYGVLIQGQQAANEALKKKKISKQRKAQAEQALTIAESGINELNAIKTYQEAMAESGKIHYNVIYAIGTHEMVLASTQAE